MSALATQVGGNHYREGGIQPIQYIEANSLQFLEASVVKRVTRHNRTTGKGRQDIEKAIHELQLLLDLRYPHTGGQVSAAPVDQFVGEEPSDYCLPSIKHPLPMPECAPAKPEIPEGWTDIHAPRPPFAIGTSMDLLYKSGRVQERVSYYANMAFPDVVAWRFGVPFCNPAAPCAAVDCFEPRTIGLFCQQHQHSDSRNCSPRRATRFDELDSFAPEPPDV